MSISKKALRAIEKTGVGRRENLVWLIDFAESDGDTETTLTECWMFVSRVNSAGVDPRVELPLQSLQSTVRQALHSRAAGKLGEIVTDLVLEPNMHTARIIMIIGGDRTSYDIGKRNGAALFLIAASNLLQEFKDEIALCAYDACPRGSLGRPRVFLRNRRARYCSRTCANNASSDAYLAKPENRERKAERRKLRFIFTCPNCKTESPVAKMMIDAECPECHKQYLTGSLNTRRKEKTAR